MSEHRPAWLTSKVDQRVALMRESMGAAGLAMLKGIDVVMTPLSEPEPDASDEERIRWELSCDGCGAYCPETLNVGVAHTELNGTAVTLTFGACNQCKEKP